jgi:hypothetical protein
MPWRGGGRRARFGAGAGFALCRTGVDERGFCHALSMTDWSVILKAQLKDFDEIA